MKKVTVVCVDDHPLIRLAVRSLLDEKEDVELVAEGGTGDAVLNLVEEFSPDILLLDLSMPQNDHPADTAGFRAIPTIEAVRQRWPNTGIIVLTQSKVPAFFYTFVELGVAGYVLKSDDLSLGLVNAIENVSKGGIYLSESMSRLFCSGRNGGKVALTMRQIEILTYIFRYPDSSRETRAKAFGISPGTFRTHQTQAYKALGTTNITSAIIRCLELGIISS